MKLSEITNSITLMHGTSNRSLEQISKNGFLPNSYFTTSLQDAEYYAATGGEEALQNREEQYEEEHGENAREVFEPDMWDMYKHLYPKGEHPVVIYVNLPQEIINKGRKDSGADGALVFDFSISPKYITNIKKVEWDQ